MKTGILLAIFTIMSSTLSGQNLYSEIANSEDHTIFIELLEFIGLDSLLKNDDFYSVFAPNNEAIEYKYDLDALDSLKINDPEFLTTLILNHFVPDTVIVEPFSEVYLPLSGSHFYLFIDGAGLVGFKSLGTPPGEPYPYLSETAFSDDLYVDFNNGRLFWLENNALHPNCRASSEWDHVVSGPLVNVLIQSNWIDTLVNITTPLTFLCPTSNEVYQYIEQNGGINNTPFVDSFVQRHIINDYLPLQDVEDGTILKNLLGEDLFFSKQNSQYYLNDSIEIRHFYDFKKSAAIELNDYLVTPFVSTTENTTLNHFKVFPNPASDVVTVINSGQSNRSIIKIYAIDGNLIRKGEYFGARFEVNIGSLKPGLYILEYQNNSNLIRKELVVL